MSGLMYPKTPNKKIRKKHKDSILHEKDGTCYLCVKLRNDYTRYPVLHKHHIFGGPNRDLAEEDGLTVYLDVYHHELGPEAVHKNYELMRLLQQDGQRAYEGNHTRKQFMSRYGRNYLEDE